MNFNRTSIAGFVFIIVLIIVFPLVIFVSQKQQTTEQHAAGTSSPYPANVEFDPPGLYADGAYNPASLTNPNVGGVVVNFSWATVEPQQGVFNFAPADKEIADWVTAGKKIVFQVRYLWQGGHLSCAAATTSYDLPVWEVARIQHFCDSDKGMIIPDYFDQTFQADAKAFVSAVAQHYANSPYRSSLVYVRIATGTGGEQNLLMYCSSTNPACDYPTDVKQLITYGYGDNASAIYIYDRNMLSYYKSAFNYTTVMYADNVPILYGATIVPGVNLNINPATGNQVGFDISEWAAANGMGIGYMGLGPSSSFDSYLNFDQIISYIKANYPNTYVHFQMGGKVSSPSDVQGSITNATNQYARTIEWYAQDIDNPSYQPYFAQWQQTVDSTFGNKTTPTQAIFPTPTTQQTVTPQPTPTINPGDTSFVITVCPHGLGNCGDNVNPNGEGNTNPLHKARSITVSVFDTNNQQVGQPIQSTVLYTLNSANFQGNIDTGTLATGNYLITIKMDGFLAKQIPGIVTVNKGQQVTLPTVSLATGDINNDNRIDISDYNILISCYGEKLNTSSCPQQYQPSSTSPGADILDDDGQVDGADYNEFLRELRVQVEQ